VTVTLLVFAAVAALAWANGANDVSKGIATLVGSGVTGYRQATMWGAVWTAAGAAGSVAGGRRVTRLLAEGVTPMNHREGLAASGVTALLVTTGAVFGLPMSTTHVSSGAIVGVGTARDSVAWGTVRAMALAWVVTLPAAAVLGAGVYAAVSLVAR
jgi:PiT family inorganic phosphate transporter